MTTSSLTLLPFLLMLAIHLGVLKLAARLYRRTRLSWAHAAAFTLIAICVPALVALAIAVSSLKPPFWLMSACGIALQLGLGGLYLGRFAATGDGSLLGFPRGALLSAIHWALMSVLLLLPGLVLVTLFAPGGAA